MTDTETFVISDGNAGVYTFEEDVIPHETHTLSISAQGNTVEVGIDEETYKELTNSFRNLD
jgi:hypothetical protein